MGCKTPSRYLVPLTTCQNKPGKQSKTNFYQCYFHTRGGTNRLDRQIVWHLSVRCEYKSNCRRLIRLGWQIVLQKWSFQTVKYQMICSSKNLFVLFAHQTICSSSSVKMAIVIPANSNTLSDWRKVCHVS